MKNATSSRIDAVKHRHTYRLVCVTVKENQFLLLLCNQKNNLFTLEHKKKKKNQTLVPCRRKKP